MPRVIYCRVREEIFFFNYGYTRGELSNWEGEAWTPELVWIQRRETSLSYAFFWVIPSRLNFKRRRFGTLCLFHLHRWIGIEWHSHSNLSAYKDGTECSETSAYKIQTPGNYPEESIQHSEYGESLESRKFSVHPGIEHQLASLVFRVSNSIRKARWLIAQYSDN